MEFLRRFRGPRSPDNKEKKNSVRGLHPDFTVTDDNYWYFNREYNLLDDSGVQRGRGKLSKIKSRFGFDDPKQLDHTEFRCKIGPNQDAALPYKYVGFAYAFEEDRAKLEEYAHRFPWAEIITNLDTQGVSTEQSQRIPVARAD